MFRRIVTSYQDAFSGLPRSIWILAGVSLINRAGTMVFPFLSLYLTAQLGFTKAQTGLVIFAFGVGSIAGSVVGGYLCQRLGAVKVQELSLLAGGVGFLALGRLEHFGALLAGSFCLSLANDAFRPAVMTAVVDHTPAPVRTRSLALMRMAVNLGMTVGPAAGGILAGYSYQWLFVVDALSCWLAAVTLHFTFPKTSAPTAAVQEASPGRTSVWQDTPLLLFMGLMLALGLMFFQIFSTMPLFLRDAYGLGEGAIGLLLGLNPLLVVLLEMVFVRKMEHHQPARMVGLGGLLVGLGLALLPLGSTFLFAAMTIFVWTIGEMMALPFSNSLVASRASGNGSGAHMGVYAAAFSLALMIGPLIGLSVYQHFGGQALWFGIGVTGVAFCLACRVLEPYLKTAPGRAPAAQGPDG